MQRTLRAMEQSLPTFATDWALQHSPAPEGRRVIPIEDDCVHLSYYICYRKGELKKLNQLKFQA